MVVCLVLLWDCGSFHRQGKPRRKSNENVVMKHLNQRGLIYTEHKPICRLYKMCNPFFYEFRVIPSACSSSSSAILLLMHHIGCKLEIWPWLASCSPTQEEGGKGSSFFSDGSLKGGLLCKPLQITADMVWGFSLFWSSLKVSMAVRASTLGYPCPLSCVHCVMIKP